MSPSVEPLDSRGASRTPWWRFPGLHTRRHVAHGPRRGDKQQLFASLSAVTPPPPRAPMPSAYARPSWPPPAASNGTRVPDPPSAAFFTTIPAAPAVASASAT